MMRCSIEARMVERVTRRHLAMMEERHRQAGIGRDFLKGLKTVGRFGKKAADAVAALMRAGYLLPVIISMTPLMLSEALERIGLEYGPEEIVHIIHVVEEASHMLHASENDRREIG